MNRTTLNLDEVCQYMWRRTYVVYFFILKYYRRHNLIYKSFIFISRLTNNVTKKFKCYFKCCFVFADLCTCFYMELYKSVNIFIAMFLSINQYSIIYYSFISYFVQRNFKCIFITLYCICIVI